ncbi:MAG: hypothetical protein K1Y02_16885, partial [Candidatus Hydrogenedentes bacterium]|nr:hypothetical protein [Candidatus Hydrogenedentota bacterium]
MRPQLVDYRRLPGRTLLTPGKTQALYAGPDHLLLLSTSMFAESYKRFYYGDIQAITVRKTSTGAVWNAVLSIGLALLAGFIPVALNLGTEGWLALSGIAIVFAVFALLLLVTNLILGPTCECSILTAVHEERVVALGRLWQARKAIASLRPIIDTVQGTVTAEAAAETIAAIFATPEAQATIEQ